MPTPFVPDRHRRPVAAEVDVGPSPKEFERVVHIQRGGASVAIPTALITSALTLVIGYLTTRRPPDERQTEAAYATVLNKQIASDESRQRAEQAQAVVNSAVLNRLSGLETQVGVLQAQNTALLAAIRSR